MFKAVEEAFRTQERWQGIRLLADRHEVSGCFASSLV